MLEVSQYGDGATPIITAIGTWVLREDNHEHNQKDGCFQIHGIDYNSIVLKSYG